MRKVTKKWAAVTYCENGQTARHKLQLANVVDGEVHAVCQVFKCREYYGDALFTIHTGIGLKEYRFDTLKTGWDGKYVITTYQQPAANVLVKLGLVNKNLKGTVPKITFEQLDMGNTLAPWGNAEETCGFLIKVPAWYHATIVRSSYFTALLRTLHYSNPLNVTAEDSYAESCVSLMNKTRFPESMAAPVKDSLWKGVFFPAMKLKYDNCMCMAPDSFEELKREVISGKYYYVHNSSGIYGAWNSLMSYVAKPKPMVEFSKNKHMMVNKELMGNLIAFTIETRKEANAKKTATS